MGYVRRLGEALTLVTLLVLSSAVPVVPEGPGVEPPEVRLPGGTSNTSLQIPIVNNSYVLGSHLTVEGRPASTTVLRRASPATTVAFSGGVDFLEPSSDLSWYLESIVPTADLDRAAAQDGQHLETSSTSFAYQLFLVDVDPRDLHVLTVGWRGNASATLGATTLYGASLYILSNSTKAWSLLATYDAATGEDRVLNSSLLVAPWRYVNRTLTSELKVIVLVIAHAGFNSMVATDALNVTETHSNWPRPRLFVDEDGEEEWGFGSVNGTGELGHVGGFEDGEREARVTYPVGGGSDTSASVLVPRGASVTSAPMDYVAYPTTGDRSAGGSAVTAPRGGTGPELAIGGIPGNAHHSNSSVLLTDVTKLNVSDQRQEFREQQLKLGAPAGPPMSWAQSFTSGRSGSLRGISIFIDGITETPGNITVQVTSTSPVDGKPEAPVLGQAVLKMSEVVTGAWNYVQFSGIPITSGGRYAIVLMAQEAETGSVIEYYDLSFNATNTYPAGQAFYSPSLDGSQPWTSQNYDLAFRTYVDTPIDAPDAQALSVHGITGRYATGRVYFNLTMPEYSANQWAFQVSNANDFDVVFNWTAHTDYLLFADNPRLDVGDDGVIDWTGQNVSTAVPIEIAGALNEILSYADWPDVYTDEWGNEFLRVVMNLTVSTEGKVALVDPHVYYTIALNTSDIADALNTAKAGLEADEDDLVWVGANITSTTPGVLEVLDLWVDYDLPPYSIELDDVVVLEDGPMVDGPLYLDTICFDDYDNNELAYAVERMDDDGNITFELTQYNAVIFRSPANWSGTSHFRILMTDGRNLTNSTNTFAVIVQAVNDPPVIVGDLADQRPPFDFALAIPIAIEDVDSPAGDIVVTTDSVRVTYDADNSSLVFLYPNGSSSETVAVTLSDGKNSTHYIIRVTPIISNTAPVVTFPEKFAISLDGEGRLNLSRYVDDRESPPDELTWRINGTNTGFVAIIEGGHWLRVIPVATTPENYTLRLVVSDPDGNSVPTTLRVQLMSAQRHPPVILRGEDALPRLIEVRRGETHTIPLALLKYWYDQEDYNQPQRVRWEVKSLRPNLFDVSIDADKTLTITAEDTTGSGYFTLRLYDSDNFPSTIESVQVKVVEPESQTSAWLLWALLVVVLVVVVGALVAARRRRSARRAVGARPRGEAEPLAGGTAAERAVATGRPEGAPPLQPEAPRPPERARIQDVMVIHESTSLVAQLGKPGEYALTPEKSDELVELSTLFAQERFEGATVGTIKAFKFERTEVLVGKGLNYFIVARCSGNIFDEVAAEMKRSIVNIDVQLSDRLTKWYPGQRLSELEAELRELLENGGG